MAELHQVLTRVLRISDDAKVYGYVEKVAKAFTVELSSYALELVKMHACMACYSHKIERGVQLQSMPC